MSTTTTEGRQALPEHAPSPNDAHLLDHEYDGIREFDNPTPGWWHLIFLGSIVFSVFYFVWFEMSPLSTSVWKAWDRTQIAEYKKIFGTLGTLEGDEATIRKMRGDERLMAVALGIFQSNCAACHANDGGGITGLNLTDDNYKNIAALGDLYKIINVGANNGAMPAWQNRLTQNERVLLAAYAANLRGTTPAAPKAPDPAEKPIPPWPTE
jgi:cytochrome c oxidase cbb3-type subunit III